MYNWSLVPFDFLLHPFCSSGNIQSLSKKPQISLAIIPVSSSPVKGIHVMGRQLLTLFPFDLSFCIATVLPLVIHFGAFPSKQALSYYTKFLCNLLKFFSQNPSIQSGPRAFQFGILFNIFFSFSWEVCTCTCLFFLCVLIYIFLNFS